MILPITGYGDPILRQKAEPVDTLTDDIRKLIDDMWETMYAASGVGLAAPQVGHSLQIFVMDAGQFDKQFEGVKNAFINPQIIHSADQHKAIEEGCLSIPHIREYIKRPTGIRIKYYDAEMKPCEKEFDDVPARIIQHEVDHLMGILFTDHVSPLKKRLLKKKLNLIAQGSVKVDYPIRFPRKAKGMKK